MCFSKRTVDIIFTIDNYILFLLPLCADPLLILKVQVQLLTHHFGGGLVGTTVLSLILNYLIL
jgi:hypothetical protein